MKSVVVFVGMLGLVACCGDNIHNNPPDATPVDAAIDSPPDAFVECNYTETDDTGNDYLIGSDDFEPSGIQFKPGDTRTICGTINNGHFNADGAFSVDVDDYSLEITQDSDVLVTLIADAQAIPSVGVFAFSNQAGAGFGGGYFIGDHAVFSAHLPAGSYQFSVEAYANSDAASPIPYKVRIQTDNPTQRCPQLTAAADYTESMDGINSDQNDVFAIDYANSPFATLVHGVPYTPEMTNLMIAAGMSERIDGISASVAAQGSYFDRDTYLITPTTNQLAVRLNWPSATADLDYYIFSVANATPIDTAATDRLGQDEFSTTAVVPGTAYWLWVGAFNGDTTALPANYSFSICGETGVTGP